MRGEEREPAPIFDPMVRHLISKKLRFSLVSECILCFDEMGLLRNRDLDGSGAVMSAQGEITILINSVKVTFFEQAVLKDALKPAGFHGSRVSVVSDNN